MTREEFEAVIAIEGRYLKVVPDTPAGRWHNRYRNKSSTLWRAVVWRWEEEYTLRGMYNRVVNGTLVEAETERVQRGLAIVRGASTNHKAVKKLIKAWEQGKY